MSVTGPEPSEQKLVGGRLCIDFINSVDERTSDHPEESLASYTDLVAWSQHVAILSEEEGTRLLAEAATHPAEADSALQAAKTFRETFYRILLASLGNTPLADDDLASFNAARAQALAHSAIAATDEGFACQWQN